MLLKSINAARAATTLLADITSGNFLFRSHSTGDDAAREIRAMNRDQARRHTSLHQLNEVLDRTELRL